jgi:hypothetical protein
MRPVRVDNFPSHPDFHYRIGKVLWILACDEERGVCGEDGKVLWTLACDEERGVWDEDGKVMWVMA